MNIAYVNGEFLPLEEARVPVTDRGLLFGDAVYEVVPVYAGRPYLLDAHLERLERSLDGIRLANPHARRKWQTLLIDLIERNGGGDQSLYLQVTRGAYPRRDHRLPAEPKATVIAFCQTRPEPDPATFEQGVAVITRSDSRWARCEIKSTALLANVLVADEAHAAGANEVILIRNGRVTEGASSNVFAVRGGGLATPPLSPAILPGITRDAVLRLARAHAIAAAETEISAVDLAAADELWLTSSTREIYPVTRLDGEPVGEGRPGPLWMRVRKLLHAETHA
jgi:D-alanine transaminase